MEISILESGCGKCGKLLASAESAVKKNGIDCEIGKVTEIEKIVDMGVIMTPAPVLDGKLFVPSEFQVWKMLRKS